MSGCLPTRRRPHTRLSCWVPVTSVSLLLSWAFVGSVRGEDLVAVEVHDVASDGSNVAFNAWLSASDAPPVRFLDAGFENGGGKAAWGDFNRDGFVDLLAAGQVWKNNGGVGFASVASVSGDGIWGDFDNDGYLDVFAYSSRRLYRNESGESFRDVSSLLPALPMTVTRGAAWGDFNGDAFVDLYVGGYEEPYQPDAILMNEEGKAFRLAWQQSGDVDPARGITAADFDEDGDLDIYVSNYRLEQNQLWRNDGTGAFTNVGQSHGVAGTDDGWSYSYGHTIGSAWGDLDSDGHIDLFVGNFSHPAAWQDRPRFYRNLGPASDFHFADRSEDAGLAWQESFASPALGDIDNDGDLDLFFTTVYAGDHHVLYRNEGDFRFVDVTGDVGVGGGQTYQAAWADYNNDGYLDLTTNGRVYRNSGSTNGWLKLRLEGDGKAVNRAAIGAQARATISGMTITRQVESATGEGNQNDLTLHFGLGPHRGAVPIEILWPDGTKESTVVEPNRTVELTYGSVHSGATPDLLEADPSERGPLQVFILAGQSNMEGFGTIEGDTKGTLRDLVRNPETAPRYRHLVDAKGAWIVRDDVWIRCLPLDDPKRKGPLTVGFGANPKFIGPELGFGLVVGEALEHQVLLIKIAWGGRSLAKDFRPPSAGGDVGDAYQGLLRHTREVLESLEAHFPEYDRDQGYEIAGFGWHQGWNDGCGWESTREYETNLAHFIRDVRRDLDAEDAPFVIAGSGFAGRDQKVDRRLAILEAQAAVAAYPEFNESVAYVETRDFFRPYPSRQNYHWNHNGETQYLIGEAMGRAMVRMVQTQKKARKAE